MLIAAATAFAVVFGLFVVAALILVVLVLRFTLRRSAASRAEWLASQGSDPEIEDEPEEEDEEDEPMTALVLAGGGTRGAVQIGMLQVLTEHGFRPDRIYGSSVGAVNGAAFAGNPTRQGVERMTEVWSGLTRDTVYPQGRLHGPWLYLQQRDSVYANTGLRKVIEDGIEFERLEDAPIPVEVVATSLTDGRERWFTYGPAVDAVLASTAIPAIFPPVEIDGERFIDGGVVNNVPIHRAIEAGASRIVVLLCAPPVYTPTIARRPVEAMVNALFISIHARFARDLAQLPPGVEVIVCSGTEGANRDFDDFSSTQALIAQGRMEAAEVVRRYGLGVPGAVTFEATLPPPPVDVPERPDDAGPSVPTEPMPPAAVWPAAEPPSPFTQPDPGT
jgi:NTE family protein